MSSPAAFDPPHRTPPHPRAGARGFTLVELLIFIVVIAAAIAGYWLVIVRRDVHLTAIGLSALVAAPPIDAPASTAR